jgi:hypothetical protein
MMLFFGTVLIVTLCCLAMGVGLLLRGQPLAGGCGGSLPGNRRCADCPHRKPEPDGDEEP